jgi:type I restriction enzyme M protein
MMAVAEHVGHDRRGNVIYRRDADGFEIYHEAIEELEVRRNGRDTVDRRTVRRRVVADDLPLISTAYRTWVATGELSLDITGSE